MRKYRKYPGCAIVLSLTLGCLGALLVITPFTASAQEVQSVRPEDLKQMIENKTDMMIVDNQPKEAYDIEHISGAMNFPWAMQIKGPVNLPRNKLLVLYCACAHEEDSTDMAEKLIKEFGYRNIKVLQGGLLRWVELGYPMERREKK